MVHREDVSDKTISLFRVEMPVESDNAGRVLASMLNGQKPLIQVFEDIIVSEDSYYSAHDNGDIIINISHKKENSLANPPHPSQPAPPYFKGSEVKNPDANIYFLKKYLIPSVHFQV
jgi:hypothetical protein